MPEMPEIETTMRAVAPLVVGKRIVRVSVRRPDIINHPDADEFSETLIGHVITGMHRRGKFLLMDADDSSHIVMHMRMTGCLTAAPPGHPEEPHTHLIIGFDDGTELRFTDTRRFGRFWLFSADETDTSGIRDLGPEPDDPGFTADYLQEHIGGCRRAIKTCLLDQSVVAGVGNIYSDEILFRTGIDPKRPSCDLTRDEFERLATGIPETLAFFTERNIVTPEEHLEGRGRDYRNTPYLQIYGHSGEPCPRCGTVLVRRVIGNRGSVYCPGCQHRRGGIAHEDSCTSGRADTIPPGTPHRTRSSRTSRRTLWHGPEQTTASCQTPSTLHVSQPRPGLMSRATCRDSS